MGRVLGGLTVVATVGYPFAVYFGLTRFSARGAGLLLLSIALPGLAWRWRRARGEDLLSAIRLPLTVVALLGVGAVLDDDRVVRGLPALINLALLGQFAGSLRTVPLVERFARMQDGELGPDKRAYCRRVTQVWCGFLAINAAVCALLALLAELRTWALYTGFIAYILMGTLGAAEYTVRKARFREYGHGLHDRLLARVFPPRGGEALR